VKKTTLILSVLAAFLAAPSFAAEPLKTVEYVAMGAPSPAHRWTVADFIAAQRALASLPPDKLPRKGSAMFSRMMSLDNFVPLHDDRPLQDRGNIAFALLPCVRALTEAYMKQSSVDAGLDAEAIDAMQTVVAYFTDIGAILDARAATLPAGAPPPPLRGQMAGIGSSALERLADAKSYHLNERLRLATSLSKSLPALLSHADVSGRQAIRGQLTAIQNAVKEPEMKKAVAQIAQNLPQQ
jgi:hypothetical protein